ncbi:MAG: hypothetical protein AB4040_20315 [Synechococcus sp.]
MQSQLSLSPRYTLDDEQPWLVGIDPVRRYWIKVNGNSSFPLTVPGLMVSSQQEFKSAILSFRSLKVGGALALPTFTSTPLAIHHLAENLYAIVHPVDEAPAWHLFDRETIEAFLMAAHPDWQCAPQDIALGRDLIFQAWKQPTAA